MLKVTIQIKEQLDTSWSDWLSGLVIQHTQYGNTILQGYLHDSTAFYGLLGRLRDLGLQLLMVDVKEMGDTPYV